MISRSIKSLINECAHSANYFKIRLKNKTPQQVSYLRFVCDHKKLENSDQNQVFYEQNERQFEDINLEKFAQLLTSKTIGDEIAQIISEYQYEKYRSLLVPTTLTVDNMRHMLTLADRTERERYLVHLYYHENNGGNYFDNELQLSVTGIMRAADRDRKARLRGLKRERTNLLAEILRLRSKIERTKSRVNDSVLSCAVQCSLPNDALREQLDWFNDVIAVICNENELSRISVEVESLLSNHYIHHNLIDTTVNQLMLETKHKQK